MALDIAASRTTSIVLRSLHVVTMGLLLGGVAFDRLEQGSQLRGVVGCALALMNREGTAPRPDRLPDRKTDPVEPSDISEPSDPCFGCRRARSR